MRDAVKTIALAGVIGLAAIPACAWDQEGHSIVAEIAQRRLSHDALEKLQKILGPEHSLASIASWADTYRDDDPGTYNWHFVDIPIGDNTYDPAKHCVRKEKGDCIVAELERLRSDVRCKRGDDQKNALMFAVHFVGDVHQPLHTVGDEAGGNTIDVLVFMHGARCKRNCRMSPIGTNLHAAWDTTLIQMTSWNWGGYVTRLENGWLTRADARRPGVDEWNPVQWTVDTHKAAQDVWKLTPSNHILDEPYYDRILPILDQQLGLAALRLAHFLNSAFSSDQCPVQ